MKIQLIDSTTKKPLANTTVQLQVKDTGGAQKYTTDGSGFINLKDEYRGKQVTASSNGQGQWFTLADNMKITYDARQAEHTGSGSSSSGGYNK